MKYGSLFSLILLLFGAGQFGPACADNPLQAAMELEDALLLTPDIENGKRVYRTCAVCHQPEAWGTENGHYPQIAGQIRTVIIKQLADIRARNRDNPTMLPFTRLDMLTLQEIADVSAYISEMPMTRHNGIGPGSDLVHGRKIYEEYCAECHGPRAAGGRYRG